MGSKMGCGYVCVGYMMWVCAGYMMRSNVRVYEMGICKKYIQSTAGVYVCTRSVLIFTKGREKNIYMVEAR
jgi:hypothetical protein